MLIVMVPHYIYFTGQNVFLNLPNKCSQLSFQKVCRIAFFVSVSDILSSQLSLRLKLLLIHISSIYCLHSSQGVGYTHITSYPRLNSHEVSGLRLKSKFLFQFSVLYPKPPLQNKSHAVIYFIQEILIDSFKKYTLLSRTIHCCELLRPSQTKKYFLCLKRLVITNN